MSAGFAGIQNELYFMDKTLMLFGDVKGFVGEMVKELGHSAPIAAPTQEKVLAKV